MGPSCMGSRNVVASKVYATLEAGMFDEATLSTFAPLDGAVASAGELESQGSTDPRHRSPWPTNREAPVF